MIKPNLIFSHDWHVQPNCQRSLRDIRLSGALLDRGPAVTPGCPRTCCAHQHRVALRVPAFLREPFKHIELQPPSQARSLPPEAVPARCWRPVPRVRISICLAGKTPVQKLRAALNINERPANRARAAEARRRLPPGSCNGLFSEGFPTGVQGLLPHLTQRTSITTCFPLPSTGQAKRPPGGSTSHSATSQE